MSILLRESILYDSSSFKFVDVCFMAYNLVSFFLVLLRRMCILLLCVVCSINVSYIQVVDSFPQVFYILIKFCFTHFVDF